MTADKQLYVHTPLIRSPTLSTAKNDVYLKLENTQPAGSFKIRGHGNLAKHAASISKTHLISSSGGNAGAAAAHAAKALNLRATIIVPSTTPTFMQDRLRESGATVIVHGDVWDVADAHAKDLANSDEKALYVSPFDHPLIWEGHATLVDELVADLNGVPPAAVVVSVGGGGLFLGVYEGLRRNGWSDVPIVAAETEGAASFAAMCDAGRVVNIGKIESIASSLGALAVSERCAEVVADGQSVVSKIVSDRQAVEACSLLATKHRYLVEPACGAAIAALNGLEGIGSGAIVVVVCGGNMVSPALLRQWIEKTGAEEAVL